jgi:L-2-hydroxyglutarate oxidase LhgO
VREEAEYVETIVEGVKETANDALLGDWVITQPGGESQVLTDTEFNERYEATGAPSVYKSIGFCRAIKNPFNKKIEILAPWNKQQIGDESCYVAITCKSDGSITQASPYIIQEAAFCNMYKPFSE